MSILVGNLGELDCLRIIASSNLSNERDLLFAWANNLSISFTGSENGTDLLKKIAVHYGAIGVGNWSETDCLRSIVIGKGITNSPGSLSDLDCLKAIVSNGSSPPPPEIPLITNVQKLSLDPATSVGTQVRVSDGFYVSGFGDARDGLWRASLALPGRYIHSLATDIDVNPTYWCKYGDPNWKFGSDATNYDLASDDDGTNPWDVTWTGAGLTLTHPASQQLASASTAQGGVFVAGGTQDGVFTARGTSGGKPYYKLLGENDDNDRNFEVAWYDFGAGISWVVFDTNQIYYSTSAVATPDLASNWKNASDDSPGSITVTTMSAGKIAAGLKKGSVVYTVNGSTNGRDKYTDVLAVAPDCTWDSAKWTDGVTDGSGNTSIPSEAGFGTRDDVAAEGNWVPYP